MELKVFEKNGETYTRFKVGVKEIYKLPPKIIMVLGIPYKKAQDFITGKNQEII